MDKDPAAARQYYETAANLGDADAMNEIAWCYLEGFGGKKDKVGNSRPVVRYWLVSDLGRQDSGADASFFLLCLC